MFSLDVQEADTEKIFYGLDDIHNASDIIIVSTLFSFQEKNAILLLSNSLRIG